jgi:hypothetical protein
MPVFTRDNERQQGPWQEGRREVWKRRRDQPAQATLRKRAGRVGMQLYNATRLGTERLASLLGRYVDGWDHRGLKVYVRYSRGADFSGTCRYDRARIYVNVGRHVTYPYRITTHLARARSNARVWWKPLYHVAVADAYQLVLFGFLHELYHWLVKKAGRNPHQKESMCDRFAAGRLVEDWGSRVLDERGRPVARETWCFQDLESFVAAARAEPGTGRSRGAG